jgi:hypothetical protein
MLKRISRPTLALAALLLASSPGFTVPETFHLMQIEQVIGGVQGDTSLQAIQLRMRISLQGQVSQARIRAWDAAGQNPVIVVDMMTDVPIETAGSRVLVESPAFAATFNPTPDFVMTNPIPASYLAAGKITWESDAGVVVWGLAWGGAAYTGTNTGTLDNDADGNFNPPFPLPMQTASDQSVLFPGPFSAPSTNNAADYIVSPSNAIFTNNAGETGSVPVELTGVSVR